MKQPTPSASKARELTALGVFAALMIAFQVALSGLANVELVTLFIILATVCMGKKTLLSVAVFVLAEGLIYGFGLWWFGYCYLWPLLVLVVNSLRRWSHPLLWTVVAGLFGLLFGPLGSLPEFVAGGWAWGLSYIISGIPFDLAHCVSNVVLVLVLYAPLEKLLKRLLPAS